MVFRFSFFVAVLLTGQAIAAPIDFTTGIITGARILQASMDVRDGAFLASPLVQLVNSRPYTAQVVPTGSAEQNESLAVFVDKTLGSASALSTGAGALEVGTENGIRSRGFHSAFSRWFTTIKNNTNNDVGLDFVFSILPGEVTLLGGRIDGPTAHLRAEAFIDFQLLSPNEDDPGSFDETKGRLFNYFIDFDDVNKTSNFQTHSANASVLCVNTSQTDRCTSLAFDGNVALPTIPGRGELTVFYDMFAHSNVRPNEKGARVFLGDPTDLVGGPAGRFVERSVSAVPEPASILLMPGALAAILLIRRRRRLGPRRAVNAVIGSSAPFAVALAASLLAGSPAQAAFNIDTGNAPVEVVIPTVAPIILTDVSPSGSDATLVLRVTTLITNAWFDASAPYHRTAQGVYSRLGRRPAAESATNRNINIACLYATYRVVNSLFPTRNTEWKAMLSSVGLDPDDTTENETSPVGIGNRAGNAVIQRRQNDGMNQLGNEGGVQFHRRPYSDYTGYQPLNTAYELRDPSRWQPRVMTTGNGVFTVQQFVTPQYGRTRPYSYSDPVHFRTPRPDASDPTGRFGRIAYQAQADEVLRASANLTDYQKMVAELFNNKILSLGFSAVFAAQSRGLSLLDFIQLDFMTNVAAFDAGIATWNEKRRWDSVRPFSAIRYLYGKRPVAGWGGPGRGTVTLPADEWKEYLNVADHPEYPSGSASFCSAHAQVARRFLNSDVLNWSVPAARGSSRIEPGVTPRDNLTLGPWATWTDFESECGLSRLWGGVHFRAAINEGHLLGRAIGEQVFLFMKRHIDGNPPMLPQL